MEDNRCEASGERGNVRMEPDLLDRIYESCFSPEVWPGVLQDLAGLAGARVGWFCVSDGTTDRWAASNDLAGALLGPLIESGWVSRADRFKRLLGAHHAGFLIEHDIYTNEDLEIDPAYRDFLRPRGLGWAAATAIPLPTGDSLALSLERDYARGPVEASGVKALDALRPHLARSVLMSARLHLQQARIASQTLELIGLPALVFDRQGKILAANGLVETLAQFVRWRSRDRVALKDSGANAIFRQAVETIAIHDDAQVRSFAVRDSGANAAMVAHVIPVRRSVRDIFAHCAGVLVLTPVTRPDAPAVELVQSLFDLTPAEARVARNLAGGQSIEDIATANGVSRNTVRSQVQGVLEKTGCRRQAEVVALLGGISI